jgi:flagellar hook-length control protein FliK
MSAVAVTSPGGVDTDSADMPSTFGQMAFGQNSTPGSTTTATTSSNANTSAGQTVGTAQVFDQIKVKITRATKAGLDQVSIQLKPESLGRVDIKLEVSADGKVQATVTADKQDTLNLLQNDSQGLERALQDAGLRTDANSLQFNLRGDGGTQFAGGDAGSSASSSANDTTTGTDTTAGPLYDYSLAAQQRGGVDTYA